MKNNILAKKKESLNVSDKELVHLLSLDKEQSKELKSWLEDESKIPKKVLKRIQSLPDENPFKFEGDGDFTFIDLFAGVGGIRLGFQQENGKCVFTSEWNEKSQSTYRVNFGDQPDGDITKIVAKDIPDFDILLGGFPCQAFSNAGKREGFNDTRGTLFFDVARIISEKRPSAFLLENVKGLLSHDQGRTFQTIKDVLDDLNYEIFYKVLVSKDFGVPQNRHRIIIVGFDRSKFEKGFDFKANFKFPDPLNKKVKVGDILENNKRVPDKYTISDKLWEGHKNRKLRHAQNGKGFGYSLFGKSSPYTNTISARYYKDGSEALIDQSDVGKNPRKLTPRECARLQGFPEEFLLPVSDNEAYKQFGNAVTVSLMNAVAKEMLKTLKHRK